MGILATHPIEYYKIGFAFLGALLGAAVGTPFVEWFKDKLGARRQWENQRNEIVSTLRLILGILKAFDEIRWKAFKNVSSALPAEMKISAFDFERLNKFDFILFDQSLAKLSALSPEESRKSAAAERLIQYLLSLRSYFEGLKGLVPVSLDGRQQGTSYLSLAEIDRVMVMHSDHEFMAFKRFLLGLYAERFGIDEDSLVYDHDIMDFEKTMLDEDIKE
jgi:hypothetical protein